MAGENGVNERMSIQEKRRRISIFFQVLPLIVIFLAFVLRLYHLDYQSLWSDEGISILRSSKPLLEMLREMPVEHVPGYFVALHFWFLLVGSGDFALRYFSLWPGVLAVALTYRLGADLGSRRAGLIAALLLATNAFQVWYAQEARMYAWLLVTSLAATWFLWRLLTTPRRRRLVFAGYVVSVTIAVYLHFYGFLVPLTHTVFAGIWAWHTHDWRAVRRWLLAGAVVFLLFLPWLPRALEIFAFSGWREPRDPSRIPWRYLTAYTVGDPMPAPWRTWLPGLYLLLSAAGAVFWWRRRRHAAILLVVSVLVPLGAVLALALRNPDFHERYSIMMSAPLLLLATAGIVVIAHRRRGIGTVVAALLLAGLVAANSAALHRLYTDESLHKPDFRGAAGYIEQSERAGDVVLVDGPDPEKVFLHYYDGGNEVYDLRELQDASAAAIDATLRDAISDATRAWELLYFHPPGPVQLWMARNTWPTMHTTHTDIRVTLYATPTGGMRERRLDLQVGPALVLSRAQIGLGTSTDCPNAEGAAQVCAGDIVRITTHWQVLDPPPAYKFSLRLWDETGRIWAAEDYVPQAGFAPTTTWQPGEPAFDRRGMLLPPDLPPGSYRITLRLYDPATGIPVETSAGSDVLLAEFDVLPPASPPDPRTLDIPVRRHGSLTDALTLLGYGVAPDPVRTSQPAELSLWWRAEQSPRQAYDLRIELLDDDGTVWVKSTHPLSQGDVTKWQSGQIVHERYPLEIEPAIRGGDYRMKLSLVEANRGVASVQVGTIPVQARERRYTLPRMEQRVDAQLGDAIVLRGFDLAPDAPAAGSSLRLTLYWQAESRVDVSYKVFVHVYDAAGTLQTQVDAFPQNGAAPTDSWLAGEVVDDRYRISLPDDLPAGTYRLVAGLYDPATGVRVPAHTAEGKPIPDNAVLLTTMALE